MNFLTDYLQAIDVIAVVALVVLAGAAFLRRESLWLGLLFVVIVVWAASRLFGLF